MKIEIDIPEGYEVDIENSTKECIKLKKIKNKLPKTWEEFCETHPRKKGEVCLACGDIDNIDITAGFKRHKLADRSILPSKELGEAMLALCQLIQLRDCYNDRWKPDWNEGIKHSIQIVRNIPGIYSTSTVNCILTFKSKEICDTFFHNFKDLIEVAKALL